MKLQTKYRIVTDRYNGYEVQHKLWWWPFWFILEGDMHAAFGDWIIKGIKGEFYPCKPDIFDATHEPAE